MFRYSISAKCSRTHREGAARDGDELRQAVLTKLNAAKLGLSMDPVDFRNRAYFDGVLRILTQKSVPFDLADLTLRSVKELLGYKKGLML